MTNDLVRQSYNKAAENYASNRNQFDNLKYLERLNEFLSPNSLILDIGCGAGKPVDSFLVSKGHRVTGIDLSEKMIELAKQNVPQAEYKVADMTELKRGEYEVDAVVSFYAIFHTPRETHQELFHKIHSFLSPSGFLLITMGSDEWEGKESNFHGAEMFWSHYDARKNRELVENAEFEVLLDEIDTAGGERHQVILARKR
jgi:cyclopropane fatty-acyl-phospholipid synthase-like methyltransferase